MADNQHGYIEAWKRLLNYICSNASCHGGNWAMKLESSLFRILYQIIVLVAQCLMIATVVFSLFFAEKQGTSTTKTYNDYKIPKFTICNHQMFDKKKTEGKYYF